MGLWYDKTILVRIPILNKTISFFAPAFWGHWSMFEIVILILELSQTLPLQTPTIIGLDHNIVSSRHNFRRLFWKIKIFLSNMMVPWNNRVNFIFCINTMGTLQRFKAFEVHHDVYGEISLAITWAQEYKKTKINSMILTSDLKNQGQTYTYVTSIISGCIHAELILVLISTFSRSGISNKPKRITWPWPLTLKIIYMYVWPQFWKSNVKVERFILVCLKFRLWECWNRH